MGWIKELYWSFKYKSEVNSVNEGIETDDGAMGWNIYTTPGIKRKEFAEKFHKVHTQFKHKLIVPGLIIARRWFLPKYKHEGNVENIPYNREWIVMEKAYNLAMEDMIKVYNYSNNKKNNVDVAKELEQLKNNPEYFKHLKTIKQGLFYIPMMDSWYHEFGVFFAHRMTQEMTKEFEGQKYRRVIYDSRNINDPVWYVSQSVFNQSAGIWQVDLKNLSKANVAEENNAIKKVIKGDVKWTETQGKEKK